MTFGYQRTDAHPLSAVQKSVVLVALVVLLSLLVDLEIPRHIFSDSTYPVTRDSRFLEVQDDEHSSPRLVALESNQEVPTTRELDNTNTSPKIKVACILDSLSRSDQYPPHLQNYLDGSPHGTTFEVTNFAVWGTTICHGGVYPYKTEQRNKNENNRTIYQQAMDYAPDYIIIMGGSNDSMDKSWVKRGCAETFYDNALELYRSFADVGSTIFAAEPTTAGLNRYRAKDRVIKHEIIPKIRQVADEVGAILIPTHSFTENHTAQTANCGGDGGGRQCDCDECWMDDGLHFNSHGASELARFFGDYILDQCVLDERCSY